MPEGERVLGEHESAVDQQDKSNNAEDNESTEEKRAKKLVNKLFKKAQRSRRRYDERWLDYYKMFRGKQWTQQRPSYRHSEVINMVFQTIQSFVPILTDSRPKFDFLPQEPQDRPFAEILSKVSESDWDRNNWLEVITEELYDGHFYGTGIGGCRYDPTKRSGIGDIVNT